MKIWSPGGVLKYVLSVCRGRLSWVYAESAVLAPVPYEEQSEESEMLLTQ